MKQNILVHPPASEGLFPVISFQHFAIVKCCISTANLIVFPGTQLKFYLLDHPFIFLKDVFYFGLSSMIVHFQEHCGYFYNYWQFYKPEKVLKESQKGYRMSLSLLFFHLQRIISECPIFFKKSYETCSYFSSITKFLECPLKKVK